MKITEQINKIINSKFFILFIFIVYFFFGITIYQDFGISFDENINRINGFVTLKYIFNLVNSNFDLNTFIANLPNLHEYVDRWYGVVYDTSLAYLEVLLDIKNSRDIYLLKHLTNFIIFFISSIFFFILCKNIFKDNLLSLIGLSMLVLSPRIFAESFYNPKDIIFMSFSIFAIYFNIKFLQNNNNIYIILSALFSALMTDIRVVGIFLPLITCFFFLFNSNILSLKIRLYSFIKYIFLFSLFFWIFWPLLWEKSFSNLITSIQEFKNFPYAGDILYFGDYIKAKFVPWHYFFVWFFMTTPLVFFILIFSGVIRGLKILIKNIIQIEKIDNNNLWINQKEMILIYFLIIALLPLFLVIIFNSTLYTGWRQLYFIYPSLIILGIYFLNFIKNYKQIYFRIAVGFLLIQIVLTLKFIHNYHPHQYVYFNYISKEFVKNNFPKDYWGLSNHTTLRHLLDNSDFDYPIKISTASFADLNKTKLILEKKFKEKFVFVEDNSENVDFIFTNYYYFRNPIFNKKRYEIPNNFKSYYKLEINGMLINELFININKYQK